MKFIYSKQIIAGNKKTKIFGGLIKKVKTPQKKEIFVLGIRIIKLKRKFKHKSLEAKDLIAPINKAICPLCGNKNTEFLFRHQEFDNSFIYHCSECTYIFTNYPADYDFATYYKSMYRESRNETLTDGYISGQSGRALAQYSYIAPYLPNKEEINILEIGCSCGELCSLFDKKYAKTEVKYNITGYEPDSNMCTYAQSTYASNPHLKFINQVYTGNEKHEFYDLIILSHVFEHVENPEKILEDFYNILKPGGLLFIEVPFCSKKSVINRAHVITGHLWFFNDKSLSNMLSKKFKVLHTTRVGSSFDLFVETNHIEKNYENSAQGLWLRIIAQKA